MKLHWIFIAAAGFLAVGCSSTGGQTATERDFGNSVRHMVKAQTANPSPSTDPVESGDGQRLEHALESYRTSVGKPESVKQDVVIDVAD